MTKRTTTWRLVLRELRILRQRPIYLLGSVGVMAFCALFFLTFFREGLPGDLPIGVVDRDGSWMSREFIRQLDATQLGKVLRYDDFSQAREDLGAGRLTSICVIPEHAYSDLLASRQPEFTCYVNGLYFVGGALAYKDLLTLLNLADGAVKREVLRAKGLSEEALMGRIQPITVDTRQIGNACTNYGYYLTNILLPGILEMTVLMLLIHSLGSELKYGASRRLMEAAGNSIFKALSGKLLVFTALFSVLGLLMELLLYRWAHFPIAGSIGNMMLDVLLLVLSSEAVAIFLLACLPVTRLALSVGALYSVMGFSLSGFTLPVEALPLPVRGWAAAFPLRHYYLFYVQEVIFGAGCAGWGREALSMLLFLLLPLTVLKRLKNAFIRLNFPKE